MKYSKPLNAYDKTSTKYENSINLSSLVKYKKTNYNTMISLQQIPPQSFIDSAFDSSFKSDPPYCFIRVKTVSGRVEQSVSPLTPFWISMLAFSCPRLSNPCNRV